MKSFERPKLTGTVTIRRFQPPQLETTASIKKGELKEPIEIVGLRVGLAPATEDINDLLLVDEQELAVMGKLFHGKTYFLSGGRLVDGGAQDNHSKPVTAGTNPPASCAPDAAVAWAFDERVLLHKPDNHRSPETPYRLERAVDTLRRCPRATELLPKEMRGGGTTAAGSLASFIPPRLATIEEVLSFQDPEVYRAFLESGTALTNLKSDVYCNEQTSSTASRLSAAAVIDAARLVLASAEKRRNLSRKSSVAKVADTPSSAKDSMGSRAHEPMLSFCLVRPPGHHCTASRPSGFCLVNNIAIAAQQLLQQPSSPSSARGGEGEEGGKACQRPRIAIIDLDVHYGEGTASFVDAYRPPEGCHGAGAGARAGGGASAAAAAAAAASSSSTGPSGDSLFPLLYLSLHRYDDGKFYPFDPTGATTHTGAAHPGSLCNVAVDTNAHVPDKCHEVISDALVEECMRRVFLPRLEGFRPDLVFVSLGFDAGHGDPLGKMAVEGGFASATRMLKEWCLSPPHNAGLVVVLEGGYNPETVAQGVLSVAYNLTYPAADADAARVAAAQVPRVWAELRQKQERRHREWDRIQREDEEVGEKGKKASAVTATGRPELVDEDDVLMERHLRWCREVIDKASAVHRTL